MQSTAIPIPQSLANIPRPPEQLFYCGAPLEELLARPKVAIVGSRQVSPYGKQVTLELATKLAERGVVIISGLALGVDGLAHRAALDAHGLTIAVLPSPIERIAPSAHHRLAKQITEQGGALVSEYAPGEQPYRYNFVNRNRLVSGLADVLVITEAAEHSGSLHTATFALDQGKTVMAVPGNITSRTSVGTNRLLGQGATPITSYQDVLQALGLSDTQKRAIKGSTPSEQRLLDLLMEGETDGHLLLEKSNLEPSTFSQSLTMLELSGKIRPLGGNQWAIS